MSITRFLRSLYSYKHSKATLLTKVPMPTKLARWDGAMCVEWLTINAQHNLTAAGTRSEWKEGGGLVQEWQTMDL